MDSKEYKEKKLDKLTRDVVRMVNKVPSFGYGEPIDAVAKMAMTNYLLAIVRAAELRENDVEIFAQSMADEMVDLSILLVSSINTYKRDIEANVQKED